MDQLSFASLDYAAKKKRTKRDVFLAEMAAVVPWVALEAVIEPHYPKAGPNGGRRPFPLAVMLRIYCLQQWYNLSDPGAEEVLYDICSMRAFAGLELGRDAIPDETTILNFRHLLERHELTKAVFAAVSELLEARGALLRGGTIVDATLIAASPSTKNEAQKRDPEMRSSKKGNQWYFGMKAHIGVDAKSGLVHTVGVTTGSVHDAKVMDNLIREDDRAVYGDKGYANDRKLEEIPRRFKVIETVREKFTCRDCEKISQPPAPFHATPRGFIGSQLLATILFDKFGMHIPLNRQSARFKCERIDLPLSTLADQVGHGTFAVMPLFHLIERHVLAAERLHGDDTTIRILAKGKCTTGRIWAYVRDDRPFAGPAPPAAVYYASGDRRGEHPQKHLAAFAGILQADCYNGFEPLFDPQKKVRADYAGILLCPCAAGLLRAG